jgi:uncharacterized protein YaaN involved in tellurite resistance
VTRTPEEWEAHREPCTAAEIYAAYKDAIADIKELAARAEKAETELARSRETIETLAKQRNDALDELAVYRRKGARRAAIQAMVDGLDPVAEAMKTREGK